MDPWVVLAGRQDEEQEPGSLVNQCVQVGRVSEDCTLCNKNLLEVWGVLALLGLMPYNGMADGGSRKKVDTVED